MDSEEIKWKKSKCEDSSVAYAICSTTYVWHNLGCYAMSSHEKNSLIRSTIESQSSKDPHKFCRPLCLSKGYVFYTLDIDNMECQCLKMPLGGLVPIEECLCTSNCSIEHDSFSKIFLHRAWSRKCPIPQRVSFDEPNPYHNYIWEHDESFVWKSKLVTQCMHGFKFMASAVGTSGLDMKLNRQTMTCELDPDTSTWNWSPPMQKCEPVYCGTPPPEPPLKAQQIINLSLNTTNNQAFGTNVTYKCPNSDVDSDIAQNFGFDFSNTNTNIKELTLTCELNGKWKVHGGITGERYLSYDLFIP